MPATVSSGPDPTANRRGLETPKRPTNRTSRRPAGTSGGTWTTKTLGAPGFGVAALVGPATRMTVMEDGQTDDLDVPFAITFMAAVRLDEPPAGTRVGVLDKEGQYSIFIGADGKLSCQVAGIKLPGPVISVGVWTHLACSYEGMNVRMVVNGQLITSVLNVAPILQNEGALELGGNSPGVNNVGLDRMTGALDAVEIWSRVLLPEEICVRAGVLCEP